MPSEEGTLEDLKRRIVNEQPDGVLIGGGVVRELPSLEKVMERRGEKREEREVRRGGTTSEARETKGRNNKL